MFKNKTYILRGEVKQWICFSFQYVVSCEKPKWINPLGPFRNAQLISMKIKPFGGLPKRMM